MITIRDPIHGSIVLSPAELAIVDSRVFQRLRGIKQLGFSDQAFPGATHTRYAHSLGAMEVATRMFDAAFPTDKSPLAGEDRIRLRTMVRLAVLLHDVGHPPASHASEKRMPQRGGLRLPCFTDEENARRASHEDYTILLVTRSELADHIVAGFGDLGVTPEAIAHIISGRFPDTAGAFVVDDVDYFPILTQFASSEMDADRMDYLQRDAFYAGVSYGKFDQPWLLENLNWEVTDDRAYMALSHRALFAFEDFLLSRYHMFVSVYYHYIPVGFDTMLARFHDEAPGEFQLATDVDGYVAMDDAALWAALRRSDNRWARRIANRQGYRRLLELNTDEDLPDVTGLTQALTDEGVDCFSSVDDGVLSKYYGQHLMEQPIYVVNRALKQVRRIDKYSRIYERYAQPAKLTRLYVHPDHRARGRALLSELLPRYRHEGGQLTLGQE
jgi:HD superfamily phosphohydrolase